MKGMIAAALLVGAAMGLAIESPAAAAAPETKAPATAVPIAAFAQFPELQSPRISPGGKVIAVKVRIDGRQALAIVPIGAGSKIEVIGKDGDFDKQEDLVIRSWRWADDDNLLIALSSRQNFFGQWFDATRLVGYNRTTRAVTPLAWRGSKFSASRILWMSHEGRPTILLERTPENDDTEKLGLPEVIKVDVVSGKIESVQRQMPGIHGWYADGKGVVRLGVGSDGDSGKRLVMYRAAAGDNLHTIFSGRVGVLDEVVMPDIFLKEGNKAIALSRRDNYRAVYELDLSDMKLGKKLFGVPGYDVAGISGGLADDHLEAAYWEDQRERATYFDPRLKEIQDVLEETFGKGNVLIASADRARETIIAYVSKPGAPGGYYVFSTVTGGVGLLGWVNAAIKDAPLNPVRTIRYKASDGKDIEAVLTMPRLRAGQKNLPLIVLTHGGPFGTRDNEDWEYVPWAQPLAELGYAVVQPNYRGSTGYGGEWEKASTGNWGLRMQDDLNDAVAHLAQQGVVDPKRVCVMGWSYGGYAASRAAQRDGAKYRCAISGAGVHDLPAMVTYDKNYLGEYAAKHALGAAGALVDVSPGLHAKDYSAPILIIHGEKDQRVPVSQSRDLVKRLRDAGKVQGRDYEYLELPRETHNLLLESSRLRVLEAVKAFLDKHNPA